jgi:[NiFe] hydrogenase assembly HybE family chaperone
MSPAGGMEGETDSRRQRLVQAFEAVDAGPMADLPIRNDALAVETAGFRFYEDALVGVLITPWSLNLVRLPGPGGPCAAQGVSATRRFPVGELAFLGAEEAEVGPFEQCSLLSPVLELVDQEAAREAAQGAMAALFRPEDGGREPAEAPERLSRRAFLRGRGTA